MACALLGNPEDIQACLEENGDPGSNPPGGNPPGGNPPGGDPGGDGGDDGGGDKDAGPVHVVIFPAGTNPYVSPPNVPWPTGWAGPLGVILDVLELFAILAFPIAAETALPVLDIAATGANCIETGACYVGQPYAGAPEMLVLGQDMLISIGDFVAPLVAATSAILSGGGLGGVLTAGGATLTTDTITTISSIIYDVGRMSGDIPNALSIGFTQSGDIYFLVYPP